MGVRKNEPCVRWLKALGDETRWRIVRELLVETRSVNDLADRLQVSQYNVSKHLKILREAGIIAAEKHGRSVECEVAVPFRRRKQGRGECLDLGCCAFWFEASPGKK